MCRKRRRRKKKSKLHRQNQTLAKPKCQYIHILMQNWICIHTQYPQQLPIPHDFHRVFTSCLQSRSGKQIVSGRLEVLALICRLQMALYFTYIVHRWMARLNVAFAQLYVSKSSGRSKTKTKNQSEKKQTNKKTSTPQMEPCTNAFESLINSPENLYFDYKESGSPFFMLLFAFVFYFSLLSYMR